MAKVYTVDDVTERTTITPKGLIVKEYRVTATTSSGVIFSVTIPEGDFSKEKADKILSDKAMLIDGIKAL